MSNVNAFLAKVKKVFNKTEDFNDLNTDGDYIKVYNSNKNFDTKDARYYGAIEFTTNTPITKPYAFPFDKNNITFPIQGETVMIIKNSDEYFWMPYTITQYPNYREDYKTSEATSEKDLPKSGNDSKQKDYKESKNTPNSQGNQKESDKKEYKVKDKIKFLKPKEGDTIIQGRVGKTILYSFGAVIFAFGLVILILVASFEELNFYLSYLFIFYTFSEVLFCIWLFNLKQKVK
jgi:hypothetical protein